MRRAVKFVHYPVGAAVMPSVDRREQFLLVRAIGDQQQLGVGHLIEARAVDADLERLVRPTPGPVAQWAADTCAASCPRRCA